MEAQKICDIQDKKKQHEAETTNPKGTIGQF